MKLTLHILALSVVGLATSYCAVYNVTTGTLATSNGIASSGGLVSNPSASPATGTFTGYQAPGTAGIVAFGIFSSLSDAQITGAADFANGLSILSNAFVQFGAAGTFNTAGPTGSKGVFSRNTSSLVVGSPFSTKNIYAFVGNGTSFSNSTELLVLKSASTFTDGQDAIPTAQLVTLSYANTSLLFGRQLADVKTTTTDSSVTLGWGTAVAVPEPSAALLGALGALGLLRRRRN